MNAAETYQKALDAYSEGSWRQALELLLTYPEYRTHPVMLHLAASCYFLLGDKENALVFCNWAIEAAPEHVTLYGLKLDLLRALQRHEDVVAVANEIQLLDDSLTEIPLIKAGSYRQLKKPTLAWKEDASYLQKRFPARSDRIRSLSRAHVAQHVNFDLEYRLSTALKYPKHVSFETYAKCNAACDFCVYPTMGRIGTKMPDYLIDKIIDDLSEIPPEIQFQLSPFGVNEPFLDKRIFSVLDRVQQRLPNALLTITSNGTPLSRANIDRLSAYKLDYLWLSVVDHRKEVYERKMKLSYDTMLARLDALHQAKLDGLITTRVVVSRLLENNIHDGEYKSFINERYPSFEVVLWPYATWLDSTSNPPTSVVNDVPCHHWFGVRIDVNGIVQHCCMDGHSRYPWGDVKKNSILEIYNSAGYRNLRSQTFSRKDVSPCNTCNLAG